MITISSKQQEALYNMERFIGVSTPREDFSTYDEFQEYFASLQVECKKHSKLMDDKASGKLYEGMKRKKEKQIERMQNPDDLRNYAIFYYAKYFPSKKKLREKLIAKNKNQEFVDEVIESMSSLIMEQSLLESKIRSYIEGGKNFQYIKGKMREKGFVISDIKDYLSKFEEKSLLSYDKTKRKIQSLINTGKSLSVIRRSLIENNNDEILIEQIILELYPDTEEDRDSITVRALVEGLKKKGIEEKKIIQRLLGKGFKYDLVKKALKRDLE